ncbi:TPA: BLUF domain-containing protein [Stenotrophomonas maltophilia]|nr:BLUF domain-containing protein [Stenotrophomonas maltophilia]HEL3858319.1 BLUF domain-containing protein [Stenotrophomonas maltophilia]
MPNRAVVFVSEASPHLAAEHLAAIMADAARFNRNAGVSGVMLYDGRRFLAYMEGPPYGLYVAFARAAGASSHGELIELARGRVGQCRLPYWSMRCIPLSPPELAQLVRVDWTSFLQRGGEQDGPATAMEMLVALAESFA